MTVSRSVRASSRSSAAEISAVTNRIRNSRLRNSRLTRRKIFYAPSEEKADFEVLK